jgi:hypothetical protein
MADTVNRMEIFQKNHDPLRHDCAVLGKIAIGHGSCRPHAGPPRLMHPNFSLMSVLFLRQGGLGQTFYDALKIAVSPIRHHAFALDQREVRIDLEKLRPRGPRVVQAPKVAIAGGKQHAT